MPESQGMRKHGMGALVVSGIVAILGSAAIVLRLLYEEIVLTSEQGPQMIGFSMAHIMPGALILGILFLLVLHIWLLIALAKVGHEAYRHRPVARSAKLVLSGAFAVLIHSLWLVALSDLPSGPGQHSGSHLTYAAAMGELYNVRALVKHGVRVDATEQDGTTALMGASVAGRLSIVQYLVGAEPPSTIKGVAWRGAL